MTTRIFGQCGDLDVCPAELEVVKTEYKRWCDPQLSARLVEDLKLHYEGKGIGRHGRKERHADVDADSDSDNAVALASE